jgi:hypothetical protein
MQEEPKFIIQPAQYNAYLFLNCFTLEAEGTTVFKNVRNTHQIQSHIPGGLNPQKHRCGNLKYCKITVYGFEGFNLA